jgi:hypothetical protein
VVEKPEGRRPLGRPCRMRKYNIKIDIREVGWESMDWIDLAQDACICCNEPSGSIKCGEFLDNVTTC